MEWVERTVRRPGRSESDLARLGMDLARKMNNEVTRCCVTRLSKAGVRSDHVCHDAWI